MTAMTVILDGNGCWPDLPNKPHFFCDSDTTEIALLQGGMASGRSSIALRGSTSDGTICIIRCSLAQLKAAIDAFEQAEKFGGNPF